MNETGSDPKEDKQITKEMSELDSETARVGNLVEELTTRLAKAIYWHDEKEPPPSEAPAPQLCDLALSLHGIKEHTILIAKKLANILNDLEL